MKPIDVNKSNKKYIKDNFYTHDVTNKIVYLLKEENYFINQLKILNGGKNF